MSESAPKTPTIVNSANGDQIVFNPDGVTTVTSSGGVEVVLRPDQEPMVAGLTAFGVDDLAQVERFETITRGGVTTHLIFFRGGSAGAVSYVNGVFASYSGTKLGMSIRNRETKAYLKPGES